MARYRLFLEQNHYSASTINLRLGAIRRLASEAADNGPLSPDLATGIRGVRGVKNPGARIGNWLTNDQAGELLSVCAAGRCRADAESASSRTCARCSLDRGAQPRSNRPVSAAVVALAEAGRRDRGQRVLRSACKGRGTRGTGASGGESADADGREVLPLLAGRMMSAAPEALATQKAADITA